ncbi:MAG: Cell division protein ZapA [Rickettsiaceae bacterium]|jgi:cell division protein ZapA|nr:Cell division protein ZapA [Rickettsiaceae bacterium]
MSTVEFTIRNKKYNIACDSGEEERIAKLADNLNVRVEAIAKTFTGASDSVVLAITALMMEDEINALKEGKNISNTNHVNDEDQADKINYALINAIEPITKYIETLANKIETA